MAQPANDGQGEREENYEFAYDANGNLLRQANTFKAPRESESEVLEYVISGNCNRVTSVHRTVGGVTTQHAMTYDANGNLKSDALPRFTPGGTGATITDIVSNYQNLPATIELALPTGNTGVTEYRYDAEGRQISRWSWEVDAVSGEQVAGTEENEWSYYDALGRLDARVGIEQGVLDHHYVNLLTQYSVGEWYRREFMNAAGTDDQPLPGNLTKHWSTYGARGLLAQTHAPMTGTWPLASDVLHGEIVLNDHLGSPRLRLESQLQAVVDEEGEDPTDVLDWVVAGWAPRNPMDYTPFGRELPLSAEAKTTPEGYTGKPLDTTFGLQVMNYGARFYDPRLGRWWQRDPLAEDYAHFSAYGYGLNNPISMIDTDGRAVFENAEALRNVGLRIVKEPEFEPRGGVTYCNFGAQAIMNQGKISPGEYKDTEMNKDTANAMFKFMDSHWKQVGDGLNAHTFHEVLEIAKAGITVVAAYKNSSGGHGHVAIVSPREPDTYSGWIGEVVPYLFNVGRHNGEKPLNQCFTRGTDVQFFVNPNDMQQLDNSEQLAE